MIAMGHSILFLCVFAVLAVLSNAEISYADEWNHGQPQRCTKLLTRKEWRTLTLSEKAEWVRAVKVCPHPSP